MLSLTDLKDSALKFQVKKLSPILGLLLFFSCMEFHNLAEVSSMSSLGAYKPHSTYNGSQRFHEEPNCNRVPRGNKR